MHPAFEDLHQRYRKSLAGKGRDACQLHPTRALRGKEAAWSTQEVIEHLVLTYRDTGALLERYLARNSPSTRPVTARHHILQFLVIRCGGFPRGVSAPDAVCPGKSGMPPMSGEELCACMRSELEKLDAQIDACSKAFAKTSFAPHFIFGPLSADQWRRFHFVHGRHHLKQLSRIRRQTRSA
ncbi:MAG TPA: DUF1569 domain-containing protein [Silvibacterium sp.]|nr:DUF1569 domain-containing protein [Silvibacterium sp.]